MSSKGGLPDAWDDDWVNAANSNVAEAAKPAPAPRLSKAERRAQHAEQQRRLWDSAENPGRNIWLEAQGVVPLKQEPKPQVTLLSRKPPTIVKKDIADGFKQLNVGDEEDSEDEARRKREAELEERQRKAKLEREDKQRRYAEARERIMGSSNQPATAPNSRDNSHTRDNRRPRGNTRMNGNRRSQPESPAEQSPARIFSACADTRQLFDPADLGRKFSTQHELPATPRDGQPTRQPRGPEHSGRGGFGFSSRGGISNA